MDACIRLDQAFGSKARKGLSMTISAHLQTGAARRTPDLSGDHASGTKVGMTAQGGSSSTGARRQGVITLARHGEPALSRQCRLSADEYAQWWGLYEQGGLKLGQAAPQALINLAQEVDQIHASTRRRARETAAAVAGRREVVLDELYIEAPLPPPPLPSWLKLPPRLWGVVSRFCWHSFNHHQGQESRAEAEHRAGLAADRLVEIAATGQDVLVLAHGYFNHMVGKALKARGWKLTLNQGFKYWCQRRFERS